MNEAQQAETLRLTTIGGNHHAPFFDELCDAHLRALLGTLRPSPASPPVPGQNGSLRSR